VIVEPSTFTQPDCDVVAVVQEIRPEVLPIVEPSVFTTPNADEP